MTGLIVSILVLLCASALYYLCYIAPRAARAHRVASFRDTMRRRYDSRNVDRHSYYSESGPWYDGLPDDIIDVLIALWMETGIYANYIDENGVIVMEDGSRVIQDGTILDATTPYYNVPDEQGSAHPWPNSNGYMEEPLGENLIRTPDGIAPEPLREETPVYHAPSHVPSHHDYTPHIPSESPVHHDPAPSYHDSSPSYSSPSYDSSPSDSSPSSE